MALTTLFIDLNSYFASVEQQVAPQLRHKPVAVAPVTSDAGCCIAASYEAKKFGVKTGTRVGEAKRLCPSITILDARPRLYVLMHQRILAAVDTKIPVHKVHSIDEVSCRLDRLQRDPDRAKALSLEIKQAIYHRCGAWMRCSIGIAPNRPLAKLATDMQKPDGLVILRDQDLEPDGGVIATLSAQELAGIGPKMMKRLEHAGIKTIGDLRRQSEKQMRHLWGGLVGERWYHWLRGAEVHEPTTHKGSIGHSHVLAPQRRDPAQAKSVAFRLLLKAAARLRHDNYAARKLTLSIRLVGENSVSAWGGGRWDATAALGDGCIDSGTMLDALGELWTQADQHMRETPPVQVGVTLHDLVSSQSQTLPLFQDEAKQGRISQAMDKINAKYGANTLYTANIHDARTSASGGIAFNFVPDLSIADSVQARQGTDSGRNERQQPEKRLTDAEANALIEASLAYDREHAPRA